ncbi:MAG: alcohol dehydrogenase catalytic domain-containing protein, partial [Negativicutes bacterium]|nr:alcohol dehydrogenase catalytic domain-containing protein [Negativicutes bacterium]
MPDNEMRVMWCEKPNQVEVRRVPIYEPAENEVLIKVAYAAICPWDVRAYSGLSSSVAFPRVLGHEVSGTVAAIGKRVKNIQVGQRVCPDMIVKCGVCKACRTGRSNRCSHPTFQQFRGGYGEYVCVPEQNVFPLKPGTSLKAAAFMEPLACVTRGQTLFDLYPGQFQLVAGAGPIGLMHMQVARTFGAQVIVSDPLNERLVKAQELGANWVINPTEADLPGLVKKVTDGWGADSIVVTVGSARLVEQMIPLLAPGGKLNIFAGIYPKDELHIDPNLIHYGEFSLTGSADSTQQDM